MKTFVTSDTHGNLKGLLQALERAGFVKEKDRLIHLGDVVDGYPDSFELVEFLISLPNTIFIKGNHDDVFLHWIETGHNKFNWNEGGFATLKSYTKHLNMAEPIKKFSGVSSQIKPSDIPKSHKDFFENQRDYYVDDKNRLFIHAGFNRHFPIASQMVKTIYYWDRDLWMAALTYETIRAAYHNEDNFTEIFIGHTKTLNWGIVAPMKACNIWNVDTGGGYSDGRITVMNVDTKEYFQSYLNSKLYPGYEAR